jgi:hypothetical protein
MQAAVVAEFISAQLVVLVEQAVVAQVVLVQPMVLLEQLTQAAEQAAAEFLAMVVLAVLVLLF